MSKLHSRIIEITKRISERSINSRNKYLRNIISMEENIDTNRNVNQSQKEINKENIE